MGSEVEMGSSQSQPVLSPKSDTEASRTDGWRCFQCDEVFTDTRAAALHFTGNPSYAPGCVRQQQGDRKTQDQIAFLETHSHRLYVQKRALEAALAEVAGADAVTIAYAEAQRTLDEQPVHRALDEPPQVRGVVSVDSAKRSSARLNAFVRAAMNSAADGASSRHEGGLRDELEKALSTLKARDAEIEGLKAESADLTKALTGLTCGGSEFFVRKGERFVADIPACIAWVRRTTEGALKRTVEAAQAQKALQSALDYSPEPDNAR